MIGSPISHPDEPGAHPTLRSGRGVMLPDGTSLAMCSTRIGSLMIGLHLPVKPKVEQDYARARRLIEHLGAGDFVMPAGGECVLIHVRGTPAVEHEMMQ